MLITLLQAPEGATREATIAATGWKTHIANGAMSGALGKKFGLVVTSATKNDWGGCIGSSRGWHDRAFAPALVNPTAGSEPR